MTRRVSTSASAIMISAATQAAGPVIWWAMLNRAMAGPAPLVAATAKASLAPTPVIHRLAASHPARPRARPSGPRRSLVVSPATAPIAAPAATQASSRATSLPPPGTECRNSTAAAPTASTGPASERRSRGCSRIWRMTMSTRIALIRYMVALFMPSACLATWCPGVGPRVGARVDPRLSPRVDPAAAGGGAGHAGALEVRPAAAAGLRYRPAGTSAGSRRPVSGQCGDVMMAIVSAPRSPWQRDNRATGLTARGTRAWSGRAVLVHPGATGPPPGVLAGHDRLAAAVAPASGGPCRGAAQRLGRGGLPLAEPDRAGVGHRETGAARAEMAQVRLAYPFVDLHGHPRPVCHPPPGAGRARAPGGDVRRRRAPRPGPPRRGTSRGPVPRPPGGHRSAR